MRSILKQDRTFIVGFSGGKDSVATWLYLTKDCGLKNVICLFADTGHEYPEVYDYITMLKEKHALPLHIATPQMKDMKGELSDEKIIKRMGFEENENWKDESLTMERLAILKTRFPSTMVKFCTSLLKIVPTQRWFAEHCYDATNCVRVTGVRSQESSRRASLPEYTTESKSGVIIWAAIKDWTHDQVFAIHQKYKIPINPLYFEGHSRVGCAPCIMSNKDELRHLANRRPEVFDDLRAMEERVAQKVGKQTMTFFSNSKAPERFSGQKCTKTGKAILTAHDIKRWALDDDPTSPSLGLEIDDEDSYECSSVYGLCEAPMRGQEENKS